MTRRRQFDQSWVPKPGTVLDGYRLGEMVDRGGMGVIMRGEHIRMKRDVAVKLLSPDIATEEGYRARFQREVDLAATIEHGNIVRCYDFGETDEGVLYLVMELLDGRSLKEVLAAEERMSVARVATLMLQVLDGMATAHLKDVVHRDLKPSNIFIVHDHRGEEVVKVLDFGLAKSLSSDHVTLTRTGAICGTANYVAPESLMLQQIGTQGDIYATGLIMLEMLLGRQVCVARAMAQTFLQHLVVPAQIPQRIWETDFGQIIARALQKHPDDRFQTAEEMYQALSRIMDDLPDITLAPAELPPLPSDNLDDRLLHQLGDGKYATVDALREMPPPEPWALDHGDPGDATIKRGPVSDFEALPSTVDENNPPPRAAATTAKYPAAEQWARPAAAALVPEVADTIIDEEAPEAEPPERAAQPAGRLRQGFLVAVLLAIVALLVMVLK